jgi:TatA/E family protein of Tat protein translocase
MLSIPHLIVIFIVALVVFGPEKLPELARMLGRAMGEVRRVTAEMRGTFEDHMRELERETAERTQGSPAAKTEAATPAPVAHTNDPPAVNSTPPEAEKTKDGDTRPA